MSESGSPSDEGSPSSSSRFEPAMSGSSWPLLESYTKETLDDLHNCQTLANIGSSSMLVGEGVVCDPIPIFCSEFTADRLENNLLDSEKQLEALMRSCSIPRSVGIHLVHCEELPSEPPKGHVMFYTQTLVTLGVKLPLQPWLQRMLSFIGYAPGQLNPGFWDTLIGFYIIWMECGLGEPLFHQWRYCYKMRSVKSCTGYAECAYRSERECVIFGKKKAYCTWKKRWCFLYNDWEHAKGVKPERRVPTHFQTVVTRGTIKLSGQELADVEKVLRVPKEDRHLVENVGKKGDTSTKKRKAPMLVPVEDILFHKEARKHQVRPSPKHKSQEQVIKIAASKKAEAEAISCAAAIIAGEERRGDSCLFFLISIPSFLQPWSPLAKKVTLAAAVRARCRSTVDEFGKPLAENESDRGRMMRLSSYVMTEYDDRLREVEQYKAKFKENKKLVNDANKTSKALAEAIRLKDQIFESLKRPNGENLRLKTQLEAIKTQLETTLLEISKVKEELDRALVEVSKLKGSIPTERKAAMQEFLGSQAFPDAFRPHCIRAANFEKRKWRAVLNRYDNGSIIRKYHEVKYEYRQKGETVILAIDPSSEEESGDDASADERTQHGEDDIGDAEDGGGTQSDIIRGSTSDEDD
ncbi:unnamed protein product [Malus baccata var. baccata]